MATPSIGERKHIRILLWLSITIALSLSVAEGHGRLLHPPSRSTMWRFGFRTPPNYNDHELFCGGLSRLQYNRGRCGICGDPWDMRQPRPNEAGGVYGNGIIVQRYKTNQMIQAEVELTANHRGYFEFKICATNNPRINPSQKCFDQNVLRLADRKSSRYYVNKRSPNQRYRVKLLLPKGMRCTFCTLQWNYVAGNNWGHCPNGQVGMGCGPQEMFRACSDVSIGGRFSQRMVTGDEFSNSSNVEDITESDMSENSSSFGVMSMTVNWGALLAILFLPILTFL